MPASFWIELTASLLGLISVWLVTKQNNWCWPTGIVMVIIYVFIFYQNKLYSDMLLQIFFVVMQIYGWYTWSNSSNNTIKLEVSWLTFKEQLQWIVGTIILSILIGFCMKRFTNADLPYIDAATAAMSITAQWLMTRKKIENWLYWIIADLIYIAMYLVKGLYFTTVLYFVFLILAYKGFITWKNHLARLKKN